MLVGQIQCKAEGCEQRGGVWHFDRATGKHDDGPYCTEHSLLRFPAGSPERGRTLARLCAAAVLKVMPESWIKRPQAAELSNETGEEF